MFPAEFRNDPMQQLVRAAHERSEYSEPVERIMLKPASKRVTVTPSEFGEVTKKVLVRAATKRYEDVPAEYATVKKTVQTKPETVKKVDIPAEYQTIKVRKLVKMPEPIKVPIAAQYATVNRQVMVKPERAKWTQVLCDVNVTEPKIKEVTQALNEKGASPPLRTTLKDSKIDPELTNAVRSSHQKSGLQPTGLLTAQTLAKLGVKLQ